MKKQMSSPSTKKSEAGTRSLDFTRVVEFMDKKYKFTTWDEPEFLNSQIVSQEFESDILSISQYKGVNKVRQTKQLIMRHFDLTQKRIGGKYYVVHKTRTMSRFSNDEFFMNLAQQKEGLRNGDSTTFK